MSRTRIVPLLAALLLFGIVACTPQEPDVTVEEQLGAEQRPEEEPADGDDGDNGDEPAGETFTFVAVDIDWESVPEELPAGEVTLEIDNQGGIHHDLVVEELGDEVVAEADGGQTDSGTVTLEAGEYTFYCSVPGHRSAGMEAVVPVS